MPDTFIAPVAVLPPNLNNQRCGRTVKPLFVVGENFRTRISTRRKNVCTVICFTLKINFGIFFRGLGMGALTK